MIQDMPMDCAVIGAGIAGLLAATAVQSAGYSAIVVDKGRGVGGRMATRRMGDGGRIDHGAQFFTQRGPALENWVTQWRDDGLIQSWHERTGDKHWSGSQGMTTVPKALAAKLDVRNSWKVERLERDSETWTLHSGEGATIVARTLIITAPLPQATLLLEPLTLLTPEALARLKAVRYTRCLTALALLKTPSALPSPGILKPEHPILDTLSDNQQKGISPIPAVTIQSTPDFAETYWDADNAERLPLLLDAAAPFLQSEIIEAKMHRWGFAKTLNPIAESHFCTPEHGLALAGDGFIGGRVEAAADSGLAAADSVVRILSA